MTKSELMQIRVSVAEKEAFLDAARIAGIPLSAWIRERLRWAATRELESADKRIAFLEER
jgi:hypothetical protein